MADELLDRVPAAITVSLQIGVQAALHVWLAWKVLDPAGAVGRPGLIQVQSPVRGGSSWA